MCACADTLEVPERTMSPLESQRLIHHSPSLSLSTSSFFLSRHPALTSQPLPSSAQNDLDPNSLFTAAG